MVSEENPNSGQGAVVLDIGGDVGALIVEMPSHMEGLEVEIIPTGTDTRSHMHTGTAEPHHHHDDHHHHHGGADHSHEHGAPPHVAVVARPTPSGETIYSLVYEISQGTYDLYVRPSGPIRSTATVIGGQVTQTRWPDWDSEA